jgi:hypothetical protein
MIRKIKKRGMFSIETLSSSANLNFIQSTLSIKLIPLHINEALRLIKTSSVEITSICYPELLIKEINSIPLI